MRDKCSLVAGYVPVIVFMVGISVMVGACGGSRPATESPGSGARPDTVAADTTTADTLAAAADQSAKPLIPATLPRTPTRVPRPSRQTATERPPYARMQALPTISPAFVQQFGIQGDTTWSGGITGGLVMMPGCTGALVSADGLVATSASCLDAALERSGAAPLDTTNPYLAQDGLELRLDGLTVHLLAAPEDVTALAASIRASDPTRSDSALTAAVLARIAAEEPQRAFVVSNAGDSVLYAYDLVRVEDVRLVFRPEEGIADFGGDYDAGTYPQYKLDVAFIRLYDAGEALRTERHFRWAARTPRTGAPAFAAGLAAASAAYGTALDARSPVVAGGRVRGFSYGATEAPGTASFFGLYERFHAFGGGAAWDLPERWTALQEQLPLEEAMSLAATSGVMPGMLGGPVLSGGLEYLATTYDTNLETAEGQLARMRLVAVPASAVTLALEHVYEADRLRSELENGQIPD